LDGTSAPLGATVMEGGVNFSLSLDGHGKSLSFLVLGDITVRVPVECVPVAAKN